jgi:hypothetical protein
MFPLYVVESNLRSQDEINMKFQNYYFFLFFILISCSVSIFVSLIVWAQAIETHNV